MTTFRESAPNIPPTISGGFNCAGHYRLGPNVAHHVASQLRAKLDAAALEVLQAGDNWGEGPYEFNDPTTDPFEPLVLTVKCKGGPVPDDWVPPEGWRMIRHADWIAAGKPGL